MGTPSDNPADVAPGDLNKDGNMDLAAAEDGLNRASVHLGSGGGSFGPRNDHAMFAPTLSIAVGDVNADGVKDLVVGRYAISVFPGNGDGTFSPKMDFATASGIGGVIIADFNGDQLLDVASSCYGSVVISVQGDPPAPLPSARGR